MKFRKFRVGDKIRFLGPGEAGYMYPPRIIGALNEAKCYLLTLDGKDYGSMSTEILDNWWELDSNGMDVVFEWLEANG